MVSNYFTVFSVRTLLFQSSVFQARELEHSGSADGNASVPCSSLFFFDRFPALLHACGDGEEQSYTLLRIDPVWDVCKQHGAMFCSG